MLTVFACGASTAPAIEVADGKVGVGGRRLVLDGDRMSWE
jgi:hypothetical protein